MGMAVTEAMVSQAMKGKRHDRLTRLWSVGSRTHQFVRLYPVRLQLLQAADDARLAIVQRVQRVSRRIVCGNVRISAYHLFPLWMAPKPLSERRLVFPRRRPSPGDDVRLENESARRAVPYSQLRVHHCRILLDFRSLEDPLR